MQASQKMQELESYPSLEEIGKPVEGTKQARNWNDVQKYIESAAWERCQLMAGNALYDALQLKNWDRAQQWNPIIRALKPQIGMLINPKLTSGAFPAPLIP